MIWRFFTSPINRLWHCSQQIVSLGQIFSLVYRLFIVFILSLLTPHVLRRFFASNFVELQQPLEFTFRTCATELAGVCSFPEAEFLLEDDYTRLQPGYYYSFLLDLVLFDTQQNRGLSIVIASLQIRDEQQRLLANFHKSVPVFSAFFGRSLFSRLYTLTRNMIFWPLWLIGFFSTGSDMLADQFTVHFPNYFMERGDRPARHIIIQLQNKFIQLSSATLRVRNHIGLLSFVLSEYPMISYIMLFFISFTFYFAIFTFLQCVQLVKKVK